MTNLKELENLKNSTLRDRDIRFDILKILGIFSIILAHIIPRNIFFHIRNFDVPLMVIVSGSLFYCSSYKKNYSLATYLYKRIPRLIAPVWLFLSFYFISMYIAYSLFNKHYPYLLTKDIINSFILLDGIGYVWVIRVFILMAIISTLILNLYRYLKNKKLFFIVLSIIYIFYEILFAISTKFNLDSIPLLSILINKYLFYTIPYGCLFGLGVALPTMKQKSILIVGGLFLTIFLGLTGYLYCVQGAIPLAQTFKYSPRLYYLSYGIFMSMFAFTLVDTLCKKYNLNSQKNLVNKSIIFISASTLWIYLWHILFLYIEKLVVKNNSSLNSNYVGIFLIITILSIATTLAQKIIVSGVIRKNKFGQRYSEILSMLFLK
ncbi:MAG: acyltransferase [Nostoc sp.]|uniref:acyltransferase family protein n=1 Tax=Nostoc sp. TaxID=1180 RepID=UPI002FF060D7